MKREVGHAESRPAPPSPAGLSSEQESPSAFTAAVADGNVGRRLANLEAEVTRLRQIVQHERKLLRKAVLMQLDLEAYDDLD
jgi:hypothetical protein